MSQALTMSIGWSVRADALRAGKEAASSAMERLGVTPPKLALAFSSIHLHQESLLEGIHSVIGKTPLLGGSSAGVILPTGPVSHGCVVILLACSTLSCSVGAGEGVKDRQRECGQQAAFGALRDFPGNQRSCYLMFADGLAPGYSDVVRGICEVLGTSFLVVGGMAGDDMRFSKTYQYCKQRVLHNAVVGALLGGPICIGIGNAHGFAPISKPHRVTKAAGPIVYELDGQPAATVYEDYLGHESIAHMQKQGLSRQGIAYPLGWQADSSSPLLLRNVIGFGEGWESYGIDPIRWLVLPCSTRRGSLHEFSSGQINLFPFSVNFRMEITATSSETVTIQEIFTQDRESTHVEHSGELILKLGKGPVRFSGQTFEWFGGELKTDQQVWVEFENITGRPFDPRIETF
ncbi:MAG: hypothetical protein HYU33_02515 [Candidatus Omnitrophica bacterium]|nr:hypothetical protein [Candidatus Omnitrophota bacterium]